MLEVDIDVAFFRYVNQNAELRADIFSFSIKNRPYTQFEYMRCTNLINRVFEKLRDQDFVV